MKKIIVSSLLAISMLALVACGGDTSTQPQTATTPTAPAQTTQPSNNASESVDADNTQAETESAGSHDIDYSFGDIFTLEDRGHQIEVTIGTDVSFIEIDLFIPGDNSSARRLQYYYQKAIIRVPVTLTNTGDVDASVSHFFAPMGSARIIYPFEVEGSMAGPWNRVALFSFFRSYGGGLGVADDPSDGDITCYEHTFLAPGDSIDRHIHMVYYGDGLYIFRVYPGGPINIGFQITK